jgi:Transposase DDE domain
MLRLVLADCLGERGLRSIAAWAASIGLADLSNVGLLHRRQKSGDWLAYLIGQRLAKAAPQPAAGRLIRLVDATVVCQAGTKARHQNAIWRIHSACELPGERFGHFELTDQTSGERLDRIPVIQGEIRIGDAAYMQPDQIATVQAAGGDVLVRTGGRNGRWLSAEGRVFALIPALRKAVGGVFDHPLWVARKKGLRLVALKLSEQAAAEARRKARRQARKEGYQVSKETLQAKGWMILIPSLPAETDTSDAILARYRLRWRIELGFKRLKSLVGLKRPPGKSKASARAFILAHLLMMVLLEPLLEGFEDSPHWPEAA